MKTQYPGLPKKRLYWLAIGIAVFFLSMLVFIQPVRADVAPPQAPPGSNPVAGTVDTQVRMEHEKVVIAIQEVEDFDQKGTARVWAEFHMENKGGTAETLMVRFPISYDDGWGGYPEIEDLMVYVNNLSVDTSEIKLESGPEVWDTRISWTEFEVTFPPDEIVEIEVDYTLNGTGYYPFVTYEYLLQTGAGWKGTIGSAEIIVRLPYPAAPENVLLEGSTGWGGTTPGAELIENEIRWFLEDFEPESDHNISVALLRPSLWQRILDEQQYVSDFPQDGDAWGMLARYYKEATNLSKGYRTDTGGISLYQQSISAYKKALELLPNDALWHFGYADLLLWRSGWGYGFTAEIREEFLEGLYQLHLAYQLDPNLEVVQNYLTAFFLRDAVMEVNGEYTFTWLTQTPMLEETDTDQATIDAGNATEEAAALLSTPSPVILETETPEPEQDDPAGEVSDAAEDPGDDTEGKVALPFCSSVIVFPLLLGFIAAAPAIRRRNGSNTKE